MSHLHLKLLFAIFYITFKGPFSFRWLGGTLPLITRLDCGKLCHGLVIFTMWKQTFLPSPKWLVSLIAFGIYCKQF